MQRAGAVTAIITLVREVAAAVEAVRASSCPALEAWLRVGDGVGEFPGESRLQICSSSSRPVDVE